MLGFEIGLSGIRSSQIGLDVTSNNIANADNPAYHRQFAGLAARPGVKVDNHLLGSGVEVNRIRRSFGFLVQDAIVAKIADKNSVAQQYAAATQVESVLSPGSGALKSQFESVFNKLTELTASPHDPARRKIVIDRAQSFTQELNNIASNLDHLQGNARTRILGQVEQANNLFAELSGVVKQIRGADLENSPPNQLLDRRDEILGKLSEVVDVKLYEQAEGDITILAGNQRLHVGTNPIKLSAKFNEEGGVQFSAAGFDGGLAIQGGSLHGLAEVANHLIPDLRNRLDDLARNFAFAFDQAHTTGINAFGGFSQLKSSRSVSNVNDPLSEVESLFNFQSGELFVSLTDTSNGERRLERIAIDPQTDSLADIANALNSLGGIQAVTNATEGTLSISATSGMQFDFAGRLPSKLDLSGLTGDSTPTISGRYSGDQNQQLTFSISGSGDVGVSAPLTLNVFNETGNLVNQVNLGGGYEPGSAVEVLDGIAVSFAAGNLNAGDTFSTYAVAAADTSDFLVAMGLNTFFTGHGAGDLSVNRQILDDHRNFASSTNGDAGDSGNILRMLAAREGRFPGLGDRTFEGYLDDIVQSVGVEVELLGQEQTNLDAQLQRLENENASITGVDPNEEFVRLMQYQRAFEMSSRVISITDENIQALLSMVG